MKSCFCVQRVSTFLQCAVASKLSQIWQKKLQSFTVPLLTVACIAEGTAVFEEHPNTADACSPVETGMAPDDSVCNGENSVCCRRTRASIISSTEHHIWLHSPLENGCPIACPFLFALITAHLAPRNYHSTYRTT